MFDSLKKDKNHRTFIIGKNSLNEDSDYYGECTEGSIIVYIFEQDGKYKLGQLGENTSDPIKYFTEERLKPYDVWHRNYKGHSSLIVSQSAISTYVGCFVFDRNEWKARRQELSTDPTELIDDIFRRRIRTKYKEGKCSFSANHYVGHRSKENPNKENLIGFENTESQWTELRTIAKEMMGFGENYNDLPIFTERPHQTGDVKLLIDILKKYGIGLLAAYTSYGKGPVALAVMIALIEKAGGGLLEVTSPRVDTLDDVGIHLKGIKFTKGNKKPILIDKHNQNQYKTPKIKKLIKEGNILVRVSSVQGTRLDNSTLKKNKRFFDIAKYWIRDEKWTEYGGPKTQKALAELEKDMTILDLGATVNRIKDDYLPSQIVSRDLFWAMNNRDKTEIPQIGIDVVNFGALKIMPDLEDICGAGEGWDPRKLVVPNKSMTDFKHRSIIEGLDDIFYGDNPKSQRFGMSIVDDRELDSFTKKAGMWIMPEGTADWGSAEYLPRIVEILNRNKSDTFYIDGYTFDRDRRKEADGDANRYMDQLLEVHNRVVIVTHRKLTIGTSIDWLGHCVLLDKFESSDFMEQGPLGRIVRRLLRGDDLYSRKEWVKIKVLAPGLSIQETLLQTAIASADNEEDVKLIAEYFNLLNLKFYEGSVEPISIKGEDLMNEINCLKFNKGIRIKSGSLFDYITDEGVIKRWQTDVTNIKFNSKNGDINITDENDSNFKKKNKKNKKKNSGKELSPDKIKKIVDEVFKTILLAYHLNNQTNIKNILKSKVICWLVPSSLVNFIKKEKKLLKIMQESVNQISKDSYYVKDEITKIKAMMKNSGFTDPKSIFFMPMNLMGQELKYIKKHKDNPIVVFNPLNGSMMESLKKEFPDRRIIGVDPFGHFVNHLTRLGFECYNTMEEIKKMNKRPILVINAPYTSGTSDATNVYVNHIRNAIKKLEPVAIINYSPDNLLTGVVNPNKGLRKELITKYGNPVFIKWLNIVKDWKRMILIDTICTVFDSKENNTSIKVVSRRQQNEFEIEPKEIFFSCESKEEYDYICSIQTDNKIKLYSRRDGSIRKGKEVRLENGNKFKIVDGEKTDCQNDFYRTVVGYMRTRSIVHIPKGPSIPGMYKYLNPTKNKKDSEKFTRYMQSIHTRYLVLLRYNTRTLDAPALSLVPNIDLSLLPDDFTDEDVFKFFKTPPKVKELIKKIGEKNPY